MRTIPGVLAPGLGVRLTPTPPIAIHEVPQLFSPQGADLVSMVQDGSAVVLQNLSDRHIFYAVIIMDRDARAGLGFLSDRAKEYLASYLATKKATP